jgi:hypothetical protein
MIKSRIGTTIMFDKDRDKDRDNDRLTRAPSGQI